MNTIPKEEILDKQVDLPDQPRRFVGLLRFLARYGTLLVLLAMIVVFTLKDPDAFATKDNLLNVLNQCSLTAIIAAGLTVALIAGDFDLSIGYASSLGCVLVAGFMGNQDIAPVLAILLVLGIGATIGLINGFLVTKAGVNAVIATLGVGTILVGFEFLYNGGLPTIVPLPKGFQDLSLAKTLGIPNPIWIAAGILLVLWVVLNRTELGQRLLAAGGNREAARLAGIRVDRVRTFAFVVCGVCAAATGILLSAQIGSGTPGSGDGYLLSAFAAVFLGSATLRDGEFHIVGTLIGVIIINVGINGLSIFGAPASAQSFLTGGILIAAVALSTVARRYVRNA